MLSVPIRKDISEYESKIFGKVTFRSLVTIVLAIGLSVAIGATAYFALGISWDVIGTPLIVLAFGIWAAGFWKPHGMKCEEFIPLWIRHNMKEDSSVYVSTLFADAKDSRKDLSQVTEAYANLTRLRGIEAWSPSETIKEDKDEDR